MCLDQASQDGELLLRSRMVIGVADDTSPELLQRIPELIARLFDYEPLAAFGACRLMAISDFSYDVTYDDRSSQPTYAAFKDEVARLNRALLALCAAEGIVIPYPTQAEAQIDG